MKKKFLLNALSLLLTATFTACNSDDPVVIPDEPENPEIQPYSSGVYIVNAGSQAANISGSLSYLSYDNNTMSDNIFYNANMLRIGDTFNDGYIFEDKMFLAVTDSRVLHVVDNRNMSLIKTLQPSTEAGPRHITSYDGFVYFTLFGSPGYLCKLNPETLEYSMIEVGPQPEYVVPFEGKLYVAVSDGYSTTYTYDNSCIAVVDPLSFTVISKITGIKNPVQLATNGTQLFVCSWGEYDSNWKQVNYGISEIVKNQVSDIKWVGNYMAIKDNSLYYIDAAWDAEQYGYYVANTENGASTQFIPASNGVFSPNGIGVDPVTGEVFIVSYTEGSYGYPSYNTPGYVNRYTSNGTVIGSYPVGVGPTTVFFNTNVNN